MEVRDPRVRVWVQSVPRCRLCSSPAEIRTGYCAAHYDRVLDQRDEERDA